MIESYRSFRNSLLRVEQRYQCCQGNSEEENRYKHFRHGGRTALHSAASYNRPYIQQLLPFPVIDVNKPDAVLKWTPQIHAERNKSWMVMDILLQNSANPEDIYLIDVKLKPGNRYRQLFSNVRQKDT